MALASRAYAVGFSRNYAREVGLDASGINLPDVAQQRRNVDVALGVTSDTSRVGHLARSQREAVDERAVSRGHGHDTQLHVWVTELACRWQ